MKIRDSLSSATPAPTSRPATPSGQSITKGAPSTISRFEAGARKRDGVGPPLVPSRISRLRRGAAGWAKSGAARAPAPAASIARRVHPSPIQLLLFSRNGTQHSPFSR
jgi:hypothetical protein